ncbi:hypothetical protein [Enterococcus sp. HY326]|uniref:hypothetical protein n=1 Tax=Enterococcus sp. HY326 TaxID=2971265 RepID=UPI00223F7273|nr:hypothetical protein [Enterococcus sp. HY326]
MTLTTDVYEMIKRNSSVDVINPETGESQIAYDKKTFEVLLAFEGITFQEFISYGKNNC